MPRDWPNLDWVRAFVAASESLAIAASNLGVTPGGVSQRIEALQAHLGVEFFRRHARGDGIDSPLAEPKAGPANHPVGAGAALARPRMHEFHMLHPEITG